MASGTQLARFGAAANHPITASFATFDTRNGLLVLDFDPDTAEYAMFVDVLPPTYGGGGLTAKLRWMATTAVSGSVQWGVAIERHQPGVDDQDVNSYAASKFVTTAAAAPSGTEMVTTITFAPGAEMDNLAVGERFRLNVVRNAADALDNMAGDAELVHVDLYET